jgi:hypothetical protein
MVLYAMYLCMMVQYVTRDIITCSYIITTTQHLNIHLYYLDWYIVLAQQVQVLLFAIQLANWLL